MTEPAPPQTLLVVSIVEGHGEVEAVRTLIQRVWIELLSRTHAEVVRPIRVPRSALDAADDVQLRKAATLARGKLVNLAAAREDDARLILFVADADKDCPATRGPEVLGRLRGLVGQDVPVAVVFAFRRYETWLVGGAAGMRDAFAPDAEVPADPEGANAGKAWIAGHLIDRPSYRETVDQPRLTARMDLAACRGRCPSFDKLCRNLEAA